MPLPKIDMPLFDLVLPSNGDKIKYRPFTVKEEKILLMAQESQDPKEILQGIKQVVNNCIFDYDFDNLALFDIEYLLVNIRARSVEDNVEFEITDPETEEKVNVSLNLRDVKVEKDEEHSNRIQINDTYTLFLKYPKVDDFFELMTEESTQEQQFNVMLSCMDKLVSEDEVYNFKDFTKEEVDDFVEGLHSDTVRDLKKFFDTIPKIRHEIPYVNSNGQDKTFVIQGTQTFFI